MRIYPVVLCGGSGASPWSGRARPLLALADEAPTFQATLLRLQAISGAETPLIVCGPGRAKWVRRTAPDHSLDLLLEPTPGGSAAAVAAAAAWIASHDPEGVLAITPADHRIHDTAAFARAVATAAAAARAGGLVALGIRPLAPATAYGYLAPGAGVAAGVRPVKRFLATSDLERAKEYLDAGFLWNSNHVVARADVLLDEFQAHAPKVLETAQDAVARSEEIPEGRRLGDAWLGAPKIDFEAAVLERSGRALVLPVDFRWSDPGDWSAVLAASPQDAHGNAALGPAHLIQTERSLVRLTPGAPAVTVLGLSDVAVVGDAEHLLLCSLRHSQGVGALASERAPPSPEAHLGAFSGELDLWLRTAALPLWWTVGVDLRDGGYLGAIDLSGRPVRSAKRASVQARLSFVYAEAARLDMPGDWRVAAAWGLEHLQRRHRRADGLYRCLVEADGAPLSETAYLYDQALCLTALASVCEVSAEPARALGLAEELMQRIDERMGHGPGGFREFGAQPFQARPHKHLLEAALAWIQVGGGERWLALAGEMVSLALNRFFDPEHDVLREVFGPDWSPGAEAERPAIAPGHQFDWAWLLSRWDQLVGDSRAAAVARALFDTGRLGLDPVRGAVVDELDEVAWSRSGPASLWPQTAHLRAALTLAATGPDTERYLACAAQAAEAISTYLQTPVRGLCRGALLPGGAFSDEPAPAASLFHLMGAFKTLQTWAGQGRAISANAQAAIGAQ